MIELKLVRRHDLEPVWRSVATLTSDSGLESEYTLTSTEIDASNIEVLFSTFEKQLRDYYRRERKSLASLGRAL